MSYLNKSIKGSCLAAVMSLVPALANAQSYDWEGFYAGATLGAAMFSVEASDQTDTFTNDLPELELMVASYGLSANYNWSPYDDNLILGAELDVAFGHESNDTVSFNQDGSDGIEFTNSWDSVISLRARAGVTNGKIHSYVAGGPAFANASFSVKDLDPNETGDCGEVLTCAEVTETLTGISIGAGMEYAFRDDWIGKFEFVHYAMPTTRADIFDGEFASCGVAEGDECTVSFDNSSTLFRFGVSYKF